MCAFLDRLANPDPSKFISFAAIWSLSKRNPAPYSQGKVSKEIVRDLSFASVVKSKN
jgi:hypothetical protein